MLGKFLRHQVTSSESFFFEMNFQRRKLLYFFDVMTVVMSMKKWSLSLSFGWWKNITLSTIYFMMNVYLSKKKFMATFKSNDAGKFHEILIWKFSLFHEIYDALTFLLSLWHLLRHNIKFYLSSLRSTLPEKRWKSWKIGKFSNFDFLVWWLDTKFNLNSFSHHFISQF